MYTHVHIFSKLEYHKGKMGTLDNNNVIQYISMG
jgi:hypothetical protein